jgi:cycloeucalenol cycloisomerase
MRLVVAAPSPILSPSSGKHAVERAWLIYTPIWGAVTGVIMLGGFAERWGDAALMTFGVLLALGCLAAPLVHARDPEVRRAWASMSLAIVVLAFGLNWLQTPYFFDVLHMRYGFHATWRIDRNPIFLYLVTIPYFATYSVLACIAVRLARRLASPAARVLAIALVPFALAFLETVLNANPFMTRLFCYDDTRLMLWFGTLCYGVSFVLALPMWLAIGEGPRRVSLLAVLAIASAVVVTDAAVLAGLRAFVAPHLTTVAEHAPGGVGGCLAR